MENKLITDRITKLRGVMKDQGVDYYIIPTADFHNSEYVSDYFKVRDYFSGFTGSNGTLVLWKDGAGLWTDGRYFIQAQNELEGTGIELYRMGEEGVPTIIDFLKSNMQEKQVLGFDGRVLSASLGLQYEKELEDKKVSITYDKDLADVIWEDRPLMPSGKVFMLDEQVAGKSVTEKLDMLREKLTAEGAAAFLLTKLDDIMWLYNVRGCDVECNPVALSYTYVDKEVQYLFLQEEALNEEVRVKLASAGVQIKPYEEMVSFIEKDMKADIKVLADKRNCNFTIYKKLMDKSILIDKNNPTELMKAIKNDVELTNMKDIYIKDSTAVTKFIYWLKTNIGKTEITEISAADYLEKLRRQIPECLDLSFPTISGYNANAAMMHYEATPEKHATLEPKGMLLVDSGGQYIGGTTDITRTIVLGPISDEIKKHYTAVAAGMLQLTHAKWLYGCTGRNLDILARQPLWNMGIDYKCGTGHGVGYTLNVHEGPQNIRWKFTEGMTEAVIESGMVVTNEPGVYIEGSHGIRIENVMIARNDVKNGDGQFMNFETLTYAPIDLEAIDASAMTAETLEFLNEYHEQVYNLIGPHLTEEEQAWLKEATRKL